MSEFNIEDLDAVIARSREGSLAQMLALQLKGQIRKSEQLAAENVTAKKIISECREYFIAGVMNRIRPTNEGYLHMICDTFADETPATDRIVAGIKADGVEEFAAYQRAITEEWACKEGHSSLLKVAESAELFAKQLREGAK